MESIEIGTKTFHPVTRVFILALFAVRALDGHCGGYRGNLVNGFGGPNYISGLFKVDPVKRSGVSLSIPRGISSARSTMTSVTSFTRTPRGLPRDQWGPMPHGGHP